MDVLTNLALGFGVVLTPTNLLVALIGCVVGTAVGVLPGLGPTATISLLLPISVYLDRTSSIILMSGIYYGAMYGGSITSILIKIPGEAASVITCLDGYQMARRGRAGAALGISAFGSFFAGIIATIGIVLLGPRIASVALLFGPVEKAALLFLGFVMILGIGEGSRKKGLAMIGLGLLLGTVGVDIVSGEERFVFDVTPLRDGFGIAVVAMGLFGISEVLLMAEGNDDAGEVLNYRQSLRDLLPNRAESIESIGPVMRGSVLGFFLGLLPGGGAMMASFASYMLERRISRHPERFGKGAVAGIAGPEAANNAGAQASFVPLLCLGIPANAVIGVIMGALLMAGVTPGPMLIVDHPQLFWGVIARFVGNLMLMVLNVPLVGLFVSLLRVPPAIMSALIVLFCVIGAFSLNSSMFDVGAMIGFGILGYALRKAKYDVAPLLLAFVLGSMFEQNLRQGLIIGFGNPLVFLTSPISAGFLGLAAIVMLAPLVLARWPLDRWRFIRGKGETEGWFSATNLSIPPTSSEPFGVDGYKTLAYELALDPQTANADTILIPTARGDLLWGVYAGFKELVDEKLLSQMPRLVAVEPFPRLELALAGADYRGRFTGGSPLVSINGTTITYQAVAAVQRSGGTAVSVKPEDVIADQQHLAKAGHYLELSAVAALTGLRILHARKSFGLRHAVLIGTSHGYKETPG